MKRKIAVWPLAVVAAFCGLTGVAFAGFDTETLCEGKLAFPNDDGSTFTYVIQLKLDATGYALRSTDEETGETFVDAGQCTAYLAEGCKHDVEIDGESTDEFYRFSLKPVGGTAYAYEETWDDGAVGRTILSCRAAS